MKIVEVNDLVLSGLKVIRFGRFPDNRGYFSEHYRKSDFLEGELTREIFKGMSFLQFNESYSKPGTIRGLHFQWNPYMGKLVRTISGRMVDLALDVRKGSPTYGKAIAYDMPSRPDSAYSEWIWVPPGFAHGNYFTEESVIEYLCTGEYSPNCEAGVSPLATDIDWSLCEANLREEFRKIAAATDKISEKDKDGFSLAGWEKDERSENFVFGKV